MPVLLAPTCWTTLSNRKMWLYHTESATTQLIVLLAIGRLFKTHFMIVCKSVFSVFKTLKFPAVIWITWAQEKLPKDYQESIMPHRICFNDKMMKNYQLNQSFDILCPRQQSDTMQCNLVKMCITSRQSGWTLSRMGQKSFRLLTGMTPSVC